MGQPFGQRIDRGDAVEMDRAFEGLDDFGFRMVHGPGPQRAGLAEDDHFIARFEVIAHEGQVPPPAMQPPAPVVQDQFKKRAPTAQWPGPRCGDGSASQGGRAKVQVGDALEMAPVLVAPRAVQEQVADRAQFQTLQLRGAGRAHAGNLGQRQFQRIWRHRHNHLIVHATLNFKP